MVEKGLQQVPECSSGGSFRSAPSHRRCFLVSSSTGADRSWLPSPGRQCHSGSHHLTLDGSECRAGVREGDGEVLMDIGDGFPKFITNQSVGAKVCILPRAAADKLSDQNLAGKLFYGMLGWNVRRFPTQNCPRNTIPLTILAHLK